MGILLGMGLTPTQFNIIGIISIILFVVMVYIGPPPNHDDNKEDSSY